MNNNMLMTTNYQKEPDPEVEIRGVVPTYVKPKADKTTLVTIHGDDIIASALPAIQGESDFRMLTENPQIFGFIYTHRDPMILVADGFTYTMSNPTWESAMLPITSLKNISGNDRADYFHCMQDTSAIVALSPRDNGEYIKNRFKQGFKSFRLRDFDFVIDPTDIQLNCPVYFFIRDIAESKQYIVDLSQFFKDKPNSQGLVRKLPAYGTKDTPRPLRDITIDFSREINDIRNLLSKVPNEEGIRTAFGEKFEYSLRYTQPASKEILVKVYTKLYELLKQDISNCVLCVSNDTLVQEYNLRETLYASKIYGDYSSYSVRAEALLLGNSSRNNDNDDLNNAIYFSLFPGKEAERNYDMFYQQAYAAENTKKFLEQSVQNPFSEFLFDYENPFYKNALFLRELSTEDLIKGKVTLKNVPIVEGKVNTFSYYIGISKWVWGEIKKVFLTLSKNDQKVLAEFQRGNISSLLFGDVFFSRSNIYNPTMSCTVISSLCWNSFNALFENHGDLTEPLGRAFPSQFSINFKENPLIKNPISSKFSSGYILGYPFVMIKNLSSDYELTKATLYTIKSDNTREEHIAYIKGNNKEELGEMVYPKVITRRDIYSTDPLHSSKDKETPYFTVAFPYAFKPLVEPYAEFTFTNTKTGKVQEFNSIPLYGEHINRVYYTDFGLYNKVSTRGTPPTFYDADTKTLYIRVVNSAILGREVGIESLKVIKKQMVSPDQFENVLATYDVPLNDEHKKTFKCRGMQNKSPGVPTKIHIPYGMFLYASSNTLIAEIFSKYYGISNETLKERYFIGNRKDYASILPKAYCSEEDVVIKLENIDIPREYFSENPQIDVSNTRKYRLFFDVKLRFTINTNTDGTQGQLLIGSLGTSNSPKYAEEGRNDDNKIFSQYYTSPDSLPYFLNSFFSSSSGTTNTKYIVEDIQPIYSTPSSELASVLEPIWRNLSIPVITESKDVQCYVVDSNSRAEAYSSYYYQYGTSAALGAYSHPQDDVATDTKLAANGKGLMWSSFAVKDKTIRIF